jgi:hypothetical protein
MQTHETAPPLNEYVSTPALLASEGINRHFPTKHSLEWFIRRHRDRLAACGALILVTGRLHFHPVRFEQAVVDIGRAAVERAPK